MGNSPKMLRQEFHFIASRVCDQIKEAFTMPGKSGAPLRSCSPERQMNAEV
jgi:hypothetical protein